MDGQELVDGSTRPRPQDFVDSPWRPTNRRRALGRLFLERTVSDVRELVKARFERIASQAEGLPPDVLPILREALSSGAIDLAEYRRILREAGSRHAPSC